MKKCIKVLTGILIALLLVCTFSTNSAEAKKNAKTVSYSLRGSVLTIKGQGAIPSDMTFKNNKKIKRVIIKKGITSIPEDAFYGCKNLKSVKLPNGLKTIGPCAFYGTSIKTVTVPSSVKTIGTGAFDTKKLITRIKLPGKFSPKYVEKEEVSTSSAVVVSAKIIEFTTPIDSKVLPYINAEKYVVSKKDKNYSSKSGIIYDKKMTNTVLLPNKATIKIAEGCTTFDLNSVLMGNEDDGKYYLNCKKIKKIVLPSSVTKVVNTKKDFDISDMIFAESSYNLKNITIKNPNLEEGSVKLLTDVFYGLKEQKTKSMVVLSK